MRILSDVKEYLINDIIELLQIAKKEGDTHIEISYEKLNNEDVAVVKSFNKSEKYTEILGHVPNSMQKMICDCN